MNDARKHKNLFMAWLDVKKTFGSVLHNWISHCLRLFGVYDNCKVLDSLSPLLIMSLASKSYHLSISSTELLIIWDAAYLRIKTCSHITEVIQLLFSSKTEF